MRTSPGHRRVLGLLFVAAVSLIVGFAGGVVAERVKALSRHFLESRRRATWSIGILAGASPLSLSSGSVRNPVLTAEDVTDVQASFVADPFMVSEDRKWYMFFEVLDKKTSRGCIGLATSEDGFNWTYAQVVLREPFHMSYPYVFKWKNDYYMIPETWEASSVRLYKASVFPTQWSFVGCLLPGVYVDPCVFRCNEKWWLFASTIDNSTLHLFYADSLYGPWIEHPASPVVENDERIARGGGRVLVLNDKVVRFAQDDWPTYGRAVRAFQVKALTTACYEEEEVSENPVLRPGGAGWNADGVHTLDAHELADGQWIACVDGRKDTRVLKFHLR